MAPQWKTGRVSVAGSPNHPDDVSIFYNDCPCPSDKTQRGIILLIHGFPETSYQWRDVIGPLAAEGFRVIAPDYRGAGFSSKPRDLNGFRKSQMARDLVTLLAKIGIEEPVHVVGHDIGGMVAHSMAADHPDKVASVMWGECPQPGTQVYESMCRTDDVWHFTFHWQSDLPEALVAGKERVYLLHFYNRHAYNSAVWTPEVVDHYVDAFSQAGAMRCGMDCYRAFHMDAEENLARVKSQGKSSVPACAFSGAESFLAQQAGKQFDELYGTFDEVQVPGCSHWIAEENPDGCVKAIAQFVGKHSR